MRRARPNRTAVHRCRCSCGALSTALLEYHCCEGRRKSEGRRVSKARDKTSSDASAIAGDIILSRSKRGTRARRAACAVSSAAEDLSGRWNSIPSAAASSSTARILPVFVFIAPNLRAAKVAIDTKSSWLAEVGSESTDAGWARDLFSEASEAAVTWAIMKPELTPPSRARKGGNPLSAE